MTTPTALRGGAGAADGDQTRDAVRGTAAEPGPAERLSRLPFARTWHPWRYVIAFAGLVVAVQFVYGLATNSALDWGTFAQYFTAGSVLSALWMTVKLTVYGTAFGFLLGLALAAARLSHNPVLQVISWSYIWIFRSIPLIVQLLFWFNISSLYQTVSLGVPFGPHFADFSTSELFGPVTAAVVGLALHQAAYSAEIVRSGIISVDAGQREAAAALGIPRRRQLLTIILPQAMRAILPNAANEVIALFKGTSIVSVMAVAELFYQVQVIYGRNGRVWPLLMVAVVWYVILTTLLSIAQFYIERHYARGAVRTLPPTPLQRVRQQLAGIVHTAQASARIVGSVTIQASGVDGGRSM